MTKGNWKLNNVVSAKAKTVLMEWNGEDDICLWQTAKVTLIGFHIQCVYSFFQSKYNITLSL